MKDQLWDPDQTWSVDRSGANLQMPTKNFWAFPFPHNFRHTTNINFFTTVFAAFAHDTTYLRNETLHRQTKMLMSIYNVSRKS